MRDRGRTHHARPRPHADQCTAEAGGLQRRGIHQREECHPCGAPLPETRTKLRGATVVGSRILRGYGWEKHRRNPKVYPKSGGRGSPNRSTGDARLVTEVTNTPETTANSMPLSAAHISKASGFTGGLLLGRWLRRSAMSPSAAPISRMREGSGT